MIQLRSDCLVFKNASGQGIPCSAESVTVELVGEATTWLDPEVVRHAAAAVLHYFKHELGRSSVSVGEFSLALEQVLSSFGLKIWSSDVVPTAPRVSESDLRKLAFDSGKGFELSFFPRLRHELRQKLSESPKVVRFKGLRGCVKQLMGARRWSTRCQRLNDHIVDYLRNCLRTEERRPACSLIVW